MNTRGETKAHRRRWKRALRVYRRADQLCEQHGIYTRRAAMYMWRALGEFTLLRRHHTLGPRTRPGPAVPTVGETLEGT